MNEALHQIRLSRQDLVRLRNSSEVAQRVEDKWDAAFRRAISVAAEASADSLPAGGPVVSPDFESLFIRHYFDVQFEALALAEREQELGRRSFRMATQPRTLRQVMELYDRWRKGLWKPKSISRKADSVKKAYVAAVQAAWQANSEDFREGTVFDQREVERKIQDAAAGTRARAQTIVRTETTRYYTDARKAYYDHSTDVTHYLFLAVRDKATTCWCKAGFTDGKRGRSGLVFEKGSRLLLVNKPPCHWCCRSELLPLSPLNPSHRRLIEDVSIAANRVKLYPLPPGWASS